MAPSITCRVYQPQDQLGVIAQFRQGFLGPGSATDFALKFTLQRSLTHYAGPVIVGGSLLAFVSKNKPVKLLGVLTVIMSIPAAAFYQRVVRKSFGQYMNGCIETDMKDICKSYHLSPLMDKDGEYATTGPNGFWVAVTDTGKVVGCIALEYQSHPSQQALSRTGVLKRFSVDPSVRTLGIGSTLFNMLLEHAKKHKSEVDSIFLETTEHQAVARSFYEHRGFHLERQDLFTQGRALWGLVTFTMRLDSFRHWVQISDDRIV
ncbi:acyl-CoA N-acyltransferase [Flagelloscypha sp. PMI_526]|nr:acyl-CoA N-acyltransferase [Flagelloscypha sp. PMI_526]